jgi:mono/diheme cytochrome c family protein
MRLFKQIILLLIVTIPMLLAVAITFTIGWRPFFGPRVRPVSNRKFEPTTGRLERGSYLVNGLLNCMYCHSDHDTSLPGAPPKTEGQAAGRLLISDPKLGMVYSANITSDRETGIGEWTDDEMARAIREGIGKGGRALFPVMPYDRFRHMSDDDLAAVIVYIRSLPPVQHSIPKPEIKFPISRLVLAMPEPVIEPVRDPDFPTPRDRGEHLALLANCTGCHTPLNSFGQPKENLTFAGGVNLKDFSGKQVSSLNLTSDASGIPYYDEATFIKTIRTGQIGARKINPVMPWGTYRNLNDEDLKAIFAFIHSLKPVVHKIDNTVAPTMCPVCGSEHGLGNTNK